MLDSAKRDARRYLQANVLSVDATARVSFKTLTDEAMPPDRPGGPATIATKGFVVVNFSGAALSRTVEVVIQGSGSDWEVSQFMIVGPQDRELEVLLSGAFKALVPAIVNRLKREKRLRLAYEPTVPGTGRGQTEITTAARNPSPMGDHLRESVGRGPHRAAEALWHVLTGE